MVTNTKRIAKDSHKGETNNSHVEEIQNSRTGQTKNSYNERQNKPKKYLYLRIIKSKST